jgi:hypothetical protein
MARSQQDGEFKLQTWRNLNTGLRRHVVEHSLITVSDSWIDISSQPSSSSLSSTAEEIITTGLQVDPRRTRRRRRSLRPVAALHRLRANNSHSSQDEYEESESESDQIMSSSNEAAQTSEEDLEDDHATAIAGHSSTFTPQPNAFTHATTHRPSISAQTSYNNTHGRPQANPRHSYPFHSPYNHLAPNHEIDHDAVLRASLSTLLSCAAARRPKNGSSSIQPYETLISNEIVPETIGIVTESEAFGSTALVEVPSDTENPKRKSRSGGARSSSKERRAKKARQTWVAANPPQEISPTLLTWVVGAGMLVLVSAISFSAGYVVGRDVGYTEANGIGEVTHEVKRNLTSKGSGLGLRRAVGISA